MFGEGDAPTDADLKQAFKEINGREPNANEL
jgi:hypothetical protein